MPTIRDVRSLTPAIYVGAFGKFSGLSLLGAAITVEGEVLRIRVYQGEAIIEVKRDTTGTVCKIRV